MSEYADLLATCPRDMQLGKCPRGFELQMIEIRCDGIIKPYKADVLAFIYEGLAIHKTPWGWKITHVKSGKQVTGTDTKRGAVKAVKTLAGLINWHLAESTLIRRKAEYKAAIKAVRE